MVYVEEHTEQKINNSINIYCWKQTLFHITSTDPLNSLWFINGEEKECTLSALTTPRMSLMRMQSASLKLFFTYTLNESTLQGLIVSHYKLVSGHLIQYLSGLMRKSRCFSYLNNFSEFRASFLLYSRVTRHKIGQLLFFPRDKN